VGAKKNNISQIDKYLKGQLDAKAMHQLERQAQDDPFLMDALEGFEKAGTEQHADLADLEARLANRVAKKETRSILLWRVLPVAACLLVMLGGGYWFINRQLDKVQYADNIHVAAKPKADKASSPLNESSTAAVSRANAKKQLAAAKPNDKVQYVAQDSPTNEAERVDELVMMREITLNSKGGLAKNMDTLTAVRINGKDFSGGNVQDVLKNLPADIREKVQIIDDYGYVPGKAPVGVYGSKSPVASLKPSYKSGSFGSLTNPPLVGPAPLPAGKVAISGIVLDAKTKEPLTGTHIAANGVKLAEADINGKYQVIVDKDALLNYKFAPYYQEQSIKLQPGQTIANANLATDTKAMSEVVIRGYVKRDKDVTTGSSYIITGKEVQDNPVGNVEQLLQGKVAGLNIQNNFGAPGMRGSVNIRGLGAPGIVTDPASLPYAIAIKVIDDKGAPATDAMISFSDWNGKGNNQGLFTTVSLGPAVIGISRPGYVSRFVKFNKKDSVILTLKKLEKNECHENAAFKKQFEDNIAVAEKFTIGRYIGRAIPVKPEEFIAAMKFIAGYTKVSIGTGASARYKDVDAFMTDKAKWLNWYEAKKCKGLK
jgi:hypothetical protein